MENMTEVDNALLKVAEDNFFDLSSPVAGTVGAYEDLCNLKRSDEEFDEIFGQEEVEYLGPEQ